MQNKAHLRQNTQSKTLLLTPCYSEYYYPLMCGIAGFTHRDGPPNPDILARAASSIQHRGPDQQGFFRSHSISLAAVRLKILDLTGGDQPIQHKQTVIAFNGEIYNFRDIRRELESLGHSFSSHCDTEVVLHAFLEWDTACFRRLNGMFAIALWDERDRRLVLARDRLGIKPLYYHNRGEIHFGSELKAILAHPAVPRDIDSTALSHFLSLNYIPHPRTLLAGIQKLAPGHFLDWSNGVAHIEPYWQLEFKPQPISLEDAKRQLDFLLDRSVREHLLSDVPLGVWLSGGLDSSAIVHYATRHFPGKLKTFSVSFEGRSFDESPFFREVAKAYDTDHHEFDLSPNEDLLSTIENISYFSDEPSADAGALPVWFLSQMSRRHVTVALSGEGADEVFGGYTTYLADRYAAWLRLIPAPLRRVMLATAHALLPVSDDKIGFEYKVKRFLEGSLLPPVEAHLFWNGACSTDQKRALLKADPAAPLPQADGSLNSVIQLDQCLYLPEDILYKCDRMSMAHSLEVRPPFLDHRIAAFAATLPVNFKVRGSTLKYLLRELMRDKLPPSVLTRKKEGFDIPTHHWFRTILKPFLLDTVTRHAVEHSGLFHWSAVDRLMQGHFARRINAGYQLWGLLTLFLWMKRWSASATPSTSHSLAAIN